MIDPVKKLDVGKAVKKVLATHGIESQTDFRADTALGVRVDLFDTLKL